MIKGINESNIFHVNVDANFMVEKVIQNKIEIVHTRKVLLMI